MWIHEGWTTYLESLYVEDRWGHDDALKYVNGYKSKVQNKEPIITQRGIQRQPTQDMYFKGALFLNTLRSVVDDDARWFRLLRDLFQRFKYQNIATEDLVQFVTAQLGRNVTPIFNQYLRRPDLPTLELTFHAADGTLAYRWKADERDFAMPVRIGANGTWQTVEPTTDWKLMPAPFRRDQVLVDTDHYYIAVNTTAD
jgi:aminopeptidase N